MQYKILFALLAVSFMIVAVTLSHSFIDDNVPQGKHYIVNITDGIGSSMR